MEAVLDSLLKALTIITASGAIVGAIGTLLLSLLAMRAKRRAHELLLLNYKKQISSLSLEGRPAGSLTQEEVERLSKMIEKAIASMSRRDQQLIEQGLHQSSAAAVKNFVRDVATAA